MGLNPIAVTKFYVLQKGAPLPASPGFIYRIGAPGSNSVYIGQTHLNPKGRLTEHQYSTKLKRHVNLFLMHFLEKHKDTISFIYWSTLDMDYSECWHMAEHKRCGFVLMNLKEGGSKGAHNQETKDKIGAANRALGWPSLKKIHATQAELGYPALKKALMVNAARGFPNLKKNHKASEAAGYPSLKRGRATQSAAGHPELKKGHATQSARAAERRMNQSK
jgi:hypothetical protein